jgi:hypothetical protein
MSRTAIIALSAALLAAGCAVQRDPPGFPMGGVAPEINRVNVPDLTHDITAAVQAGFGVREGTLTVAGDNPIVEEELNLTLKKLGYRVVPKNGRHTVLYAVTPLGPTLMVTWRIDGQRSAKLYRSGPTGELIPATPTTITEG